MNFTLTINGDTPAELLAALQQLNTPPLQPPQSEPVTQSDKPKAQQTPAKQKKATQKPAAAPAEEPANPTTAEASGSPSQADAAPAASTSAPTPDPAMLDKIRDLARSLIVAGKRAGVQAAIKATGAASISKLPPDSYTSVWEELLKLKGEVDANAAN